MKFSTQQTLGGMFACFVIVMAWFSPWWIWGKNLAPLDLNSEMMRPWRAENAPVNPKNHIVSDASDQTIVYRIVAAENYRKEGWVGWSSLTYGGTAQYANTMALYFDWTMQLHRWFGFWTAWHLGLMGQVLIAAWGMLLFLRGRSIGVVVACCGALAYAANSQFVTWVYHRWALGAFCWVPWILWAADSYRRGNRSYWGLVPVFIGMAFLGGTLQHAALVVLAVVALWIEELWSLRSVRKEKCPRSGRVRQARLIGRYAAWGMLGIALAAMMFAPCTDAFLKSNRLHLHTGLYGNPQNGIYPEGPLQPLFNLAAYPFQIFPSVLGRCNSIDVLKLFRSQLFYIAYFGSFPVLVALLALCRKQSPVLARILIGLGLLLPLTPLVRVLYQRLFLLFILGGILAFAHFMETATRETRLKIFRITATLATAVTFAWTSISVLFWFRPGPLDKLREKILLEGKGSSFGFFTDWIAARADHFTHDLFIWSPQQLVPLLLFGATLAGLRWTAAFQEGWRRKGLWLVTLAVIGEVSLFGSRWVVWTDPALHPLFPPTPETIALQQLVGHEGRVSTLIHPTSHMACTPFIPNTLSPYGIASITGYDSIVPAGMVLPDRFSGDADKLGRFGVSHLITWPGNPDVPPAWRLVWNSPSMDLYQNPLAYPRTMGFRTAADKESFFAGSNPEIVPIRETSGMENRRSLEIPSGTHWVRLAENEDDGWEYRMKSSSAWQMVRRAPDASMLFENPDPTRATIIEMRYNPPLRRLGLVLSAAALVLLILAQLVMLRNRTQSPHCATPA